jgi:hypothetical protein
VSVGQYSHYCSTDFGDKPIGKFAQGSAQLNDCSTVLFMWGGSADTYGDSPLNDLWSFDLNTRKWKWISGSDIINSNGNFGIKGVSAPSNMPSGVQCH